MAKTPVDDPNPPPLRRVGITGLRQYGGYVREEFLKELSGSKAMRVFREMRDNDDVVGAVMHAIESLLRAVEWSIRPDDENNPDDVTAADFIRECIDDLEVGWEDHIAEIVTFLTFGWSLHEIVYKRREDGKLGWEGFPIRAQESLLKWEWDMDADKAVGMWQLPPTGGPTVLIPFVKALLFRTTTHKANPEGRSVLRNAYKGYYRKTHIEAIEGIGVERDLSGLPVMYVPSEWTDPDATPALKTLFEYAKKIVRDTKQDEQMGIVLPNIIDPETKVPLLKLELLSSSSRRAINTDGIILRYSRGIAGTLLADFVLLGHNQVGSFALSQDKTDLFQYSLTAWMDVIATQFNSKAITDLLELNAMQGKCSLYHGVIEKPDLKTISQFLFQLSQGGFLTPNADLEQHLRTIANFPLIDTDEREQIIREHTDVESDLSPSDAKDPPGGQQPASPAAKPAAKPTAQTKPAPTTVPQFALGRGRRKPPK